MGVEFGYFTRNARSYMVNVTYTRRLDVNEALENLARQNTQRLVAQIFLLPSEAPASGNGRVATLPLPSTPLPREKPVPKPREETTWEKFAKLKGISKRKKDKIEYDEKSGEWKRSYGFKRANDETDVWAIPAKEGEDDGIDPWERAARETAARSGD